MGFGRRIQYFLVHTLKYTNKEAKALIAAKKVCVGTDIIDSNIELKDSDEITVDGKLVKKYAPVYIKYYKPVGYVSSLNENVKDSLFEVFKDHLPLTIVGRLDKSSEGLLILTNDGKWARQITDPKNHKEKEYIVKVEQKIDIPFTNKMGAGVDIGFYFTKPCKCWIIDEFTFGIILTEGKNKQIRRMCKSLEHRVVYLKRTRIHSTSIDNQEVGIFEVLKK
ncbi:MAG: pseudouridine synthase [Bacteroidota bacterium]|nr:pseudouridine synthase [Bacteroidota bacterium]